MYTTYKDWMSHKSYFSLEVENSLSMYPSALTGNNDLGAGGAYPTWGGMFFKFAQSSPSLLHWFVFCLGFLCKNVSLNSRFNKKQLIILHNNMKVIDYFS